MHFDCMAKSLLCYGVELIIYILKLFCKSEKEKNEKNKHFELIYETAKK